MTKTILRKLEALDAAEDPAYYQFQFDLLTLAKELDAKLFQRDLEIPNLEDLARERYRVSGKRLR